MADSELSDHVSQLLSACCGLRTLQELFESRDQYGEAYLIESIRKTVSSSAEAFDTAQSNFKKSPPPLQMIK